AEVVLARVQRNLDPLAPLAGITRLDELAARPDENTSVGPGCLDRPFDDEPHELARVVRGSEGLAKTRGDVPEAPALGVELIEPRLQLVRHLVESASEQGQLVPTLHRDTLLQVAPGDRSCGVNETADRAHDRTPFDIGDARNEKKRSEDAD